MHDEMFDAIQSNAMRRCDEIPMITGDKMYKRSPDVMRHNEIQQPRIGPRSHVDQDAAADGCDVMQ